MSSYKIVVIPGDGIGPELTDATLKVLEAVQKRFRLKLNIIQAEAGDECFNKHGVALPEETIQKIKSSHTCLKGPVGETAADVIVKLRLMFDLYANIRPIKTYLPNMSIRPDIDFVFVRENTEDVYRGLEFSLGDAAVCMRVISRRGSERIARKAFEIARRRNKKKKVTAIHKANVMRLTCGLFASVCREIAKQYPDLTFEEQYVDAAAMRLIKEPQNYDVIVTTNMFGDILSDEAAQLVGGLGMAPGANVGDNFAIFEPIHGSAPTRAGKQTANPCSMILAAKMMLDWLSEQHDDAECEKAAMVVEEAMMKTLYSEKVVPDLGGKAKTIEMGEAIAEKIVNTYAKV